MPIPFEATLMGLCDFTEVEKDAMRDQVTRLYWGVSLEEFKARVARGEYTEELATSVIVPPYLRARN